MRSLNLHRTSTGLAVEDPVVIETTGGDLRAIADQVVIDGATLRYKSDKQPFELPLIGENKFSVTPDGLTLTAPGSNGETYTLRRVSDADGSWASSIKAPAPTDSLEQLALGGSYMGNVPFNDADENLWVALDPDTEELRELVYSSPAGIYARSGGGWFKFPEDDESLDGMESIDVESEFITAFDEAAADAIPLTKDDVMEYAKPEEPESEPEPVPAVEPESVSEPVPEPELTPDDEE